jgi:hypothetical protein
MATKGLTNKEQRFAKAVADGATQASAYSSVYSAEGSASTQRANGHKITKKPRVAEEIQRLRRLPAVDDYAGIKKQMIERLLDIAENGKNSVSQHRAILALIRYADEGVERQPAKDPVPDVEQLLRELRADIEVKSSAELITQADTVGVHVDKTPPVQVEDLRVEDDYGLVPDKPQQPRLVNTGCQISELAKEKALIGEREPDSSIARTGYTAAPGADLEASGSLPGYRREMIAGRFPPQYRWVPIVDEED